MTAVVASSGTLAQTYRRFAEGEAASTSAMYQHVAIALSESEAAMRAIAAVPVRKRRPAVILAALHDLALSGRARLLAAAYELGDVEAAATAAINTLLELTDTIVDIAAHRTPRYDDTGRCGVLYPAIAEVARRTGVNTVGLIDVGCSAGFNLVVDSVGITYSDGLALGEPSSPVQLSPSLVGERHIPMQAIPRVTARVGIDAVPLDVTDADDNRWMRACLSPDQPDRAARLDAELALAAAAPLLLLRGDPVDLLSDALTHVPADAVPVVMTTWALSRFSVAKRLRFLQRLQEAARERTVAWVSAEGVAVAPTVPTLGDRPASGHSIIGVAVFDGSINNVTAVGRCWSKGRMLAWLADPEE